MSFFSHINSGGISAVITHDHAVSPEPVRNTAPKWETSTRIWGRQAALLRDKAPVRKSQPTRPVALRDATPVNAQSLSHGTKLFMREPLFTMAYGFRARQSFLTMEQMAAPWSRT